MNSDLPSAVLRVRARLARPSELLAEIQAATARVVAPRQHHEKTMVATDAIRLALEELDHAQEELRLVQDYLHAQTDELTHAARLLESQRCYYEDLFRTATDPCLVTDPHGVVLDANQSASELFAIELGSGRGHLSDFVTPEQKSRLAELLRLPAQECLARGELRVMTKRSEEPLTVQVSVARVLRGGDGAIDLHWILRPARPSAEGLSLLQWQTRLESERRAHGQTKAVLRENQGLLRMAASELRTPLSAIMGWTEILESKRADAFGTERIASGLRQSAFVLARMLEDLVDDAQAARGQLMLELSRLSLPDLVARVVDDQRPNAEQRSVRLTSVLDHTLPMLEGDPYRLEQMLGNLIESALQFTDLGGGLQVHLARRDGSAELIVRDSSHVLTSEPLIGICDAFVQVQRGAESDPAVLGLGLDLARRVCELHGGTFEVARSGGGSATFTVRLPLRRADAAQMRRAQRELS